MGIFDKIFNLNPHNKTPEEFSTEKISFEPRPASEIMENQNKGTEEESEVKNLESVEK